jgi:hypothetical protein
MRENEANSQKEGLRSNVAHPFTHPCSAAPTVGSRVSVSERRRRTPPLTDGPTSRSSRRARPGAPPPRPLIGSNRTTGREEGGRAGRICDGVVQGEVVIVLLRL